MADNRSTALPLKESAHKPTWRELPATAAGRTVPWSMEERYSYVGNTPVLKSLTAALGKSRKL